MSGERLIVALCPTNHENVNEVGFKQNVDRDIVDFVFT